MNRREFLHLLLTLPAMVVVPWGDTTHHLITPADLRFVSERAFSVDQIRRAYKSVVINMPARWRDKKDQDRAISEIGKAILSWQKRNRQVEVFGPAQMQEVIMEAGDELSLIRHAGVVTADQVPIRAGMLRTWELMVD